MTAAFFPPKSRLRYLKTIASGTPSNAQKSMKTDRRKTRLDPKASAGKTGGMLAENSTDEEFEDGGDPYADHRDADPVDSWDEADYKVGEEDE